MLDDLMELPWPVGAVLAVLCYPIALLLSGYLASQPSQILESISSMPLKLWPLFAVLFGFASLMSFIIGIKKKNLYKLNQSLEKIRGLSWREFEYYIGEHFKNQGYFVVETPEGPDGGIDLVLRKDGEKTFVQCKHWKSAKVGVEKVRALLGSMVSGGAHNGIFVTIGSYTQPAIDFGVQHGIQMIDGSSLEKIIGIYPVEEPQHEKSKTNTSSLLCPVCNATMVKRVAKRGSNKGNSFWGCSKYPACKGIRNI